MATKKAGLLAPDGSTYVTMTDGNGTSGGTNLIGNVGVKVGVTDSAGTIVFPDSFAQVLTYNGDGTVNTITFTDTVNTWTQTLTYTTGLVTGISKWVKS